MRNEPRRSQTTVCVANELRDTLRAPPAAYNTDIPVEPQQMPDIHVDSARARAPQEVARLPSHSSFIRSGATASGSGGGGLRWPSACWTDIDVGPPLDRGQICSYLDVRGEAASAP